MVLPGMVENVKPEEDFQVNPQGQKWERLWSEHDSSSYWKNDKNANVGWEFALKCASPKEQSRTLERM